MADHFHNPVLDGTAVYFTSEGGAVTPACTTVDNACTVQFTSQSLRPTNGRITILARTTGEEAFTDLNGNGTADSGEMIDANFNTTDIGEAYLDYNEDGIRDQTREPYIDFSGNGVYGGGDGKYNGQLCTSGAAICSPQKSIDVRASTVIVLSSSSAVITINSGAAINLSASPSFTVNVVDLHGNAMPSEIRLYHYGYNLSNEEMKNKYKRTGDLLRKQLAEDPNNIFALANLVRNYRNEYNFEKVIELGKAGLNIPASPTDVDARNQRLRIYIDLAYALLNTNQTNRAEEICRDAINENPDSLDILYVMGDILSRKGEFAEAINYFKKYLVIKDTENKNPTVNLRIVDTYYYEHKAYNNIGECYNRLGLPDKAELAYKKAIELNDRESLYYSNLAHLYISQNRFQEAENITNTAIKFGIDNHLIYLLMGKAQIMQGKAHEAIHTLKQRIQKNNNDLNAHIFLVNLLLQTNQIKEAEEALKTIISSHPDNLELKCLMERIKFKNGDRQSAIKFIQNTLNSNPTDASAYLKLGNLCIEIEDHTTAIELLEKHLEISPDNADVVATIAICYARLGRLESAIIGLRAALKLDPTCHYASQNLISLEKKFKNQPPANLKNEVTV